MTDEPTKKPLRSQAWFARQDKMGFVYRSWLKNRGFPQDQFDGRPVIGICNTWSQATPCNAHFREIAQHVRDGVLDSGGFPIEFPVMSLGETLMRPTTMLFRNQAAMDVEECVRANPFDQQSSVARVQARFDDVGQRAFGTADRRDLAELFGEPQEIVGHETMPCSRRIALSFSRSCSSPSAR